MTAAEAAAGKSNIMRGTAERVLIDILKCGTQRRCFVYRMSPTISGELASRQSLFVLAVYM